MKLPITLVRCDGSTLEQNSFTDNISSTGVLFHTDRKIDVGASVEYVLTLSPAMGPRKSVQLHCLGKVVRQGTDDSVAATVERYEFVRV